MKFLDHLSQNVDRGEEVIEDPHLRPQVRNVHPEVFQPNLVGRTENLHAFFHALADRLGVAIPADVDLPISNRQNSRDKTASLITSDSLRRIAHVFAADFEWLNEDVDSWRP